MNKNKSLATTILTAIANYGTLLTLTYHLVEDFFPLVLKGPLHGHNLNLCPLGEESLLFVPHFSSRFVLSLGQMSWKGAPGTLDGNNIYTALTSLQTQQTPVKQQNKQKNAETFEQNLTKQKYQQSNVKTFEVRRATSPARRKTGLD